MHCREAGAAWVPPSVQVKGSLRGYWRLACLLASNARQRVDQLVLHLPADQVSSLKQLAAGG